MSKKYYIKGGITVEVSDELHEYLKQSDRKIRYIEKDLKRSKYKIDMKKEKVTVISSREDSLERLMNIGKDYPEPSSDFSLPITEKITLEQALEKLNDKEKYLIVQLFYCGRSEQSVADEMGIGQSSVNRKKNRILAKLHKLLDN